MATSRLDAQVTQALGALQGRVTTGPAALYLLASGVDVLAGRLRDGTRWPLARIEGVPAAWRDHVLHGGMLNGLPVWLLEASPREATAADAPFEVAFPVWLAAAAGASTLLTCCTGTALTDSAPEPGSLAFASDHLNLTGSSPLVALGESRLGAQFPDQSRVHDAALRKLGLAAARRMGLDAHEAVVACGLGPTLETPAESRWMQRAGASVSAQGLAPFLMAAAHAGMGGLALVIVLRHADEALDIAAIAARAEALAPAVDDLLAALSADVLRTARARLDEIGR